MVSRASSNKMAVSDEEDLLQLDGLVEGVKKMVVRPRMRLKVKLKLKQNKQNMRTYLPLRCEGKTKKGLREGCCGRPWLED